MSASALPAAACDHCGGPMPCEEHAPCSVCGGEERGQGGYLQCECPAPLKPLAAVAPQFPNRIAGWHLPLTGDYAEPATAGGGYCEMQADGVLDVAYEADSAARDMGMPTFLLTRIPVDVLRALVNAYDAKARKLAAPAPGSDGELLEGLTSAIENIGVGLARVSLGDHEAFNELASVLTEAAIVAQLLAVRS